MHIERVQLINNLNRFSLTFDQASHKHWQQEESVPKLKMHIALNKDLCWKGLVEMPIDMHSQLLHLKIINDLMVFVISIIRTESTDHNRSKIKGF
jgi:hypothetical protein